MKRFLKTAAFTLLVTIGGSWQIQSFAQPGNYYDYDDGDVSYQSFYDELSPHGRWIDYPEYGYVWTPSGIAGFRPYETGGRWVWTDDYEWMWVSDYSWGWAAFHYGRWFHDPFYGWMWVPGYEWAPAWVAWRDGGDYYGWAPLKPGFNIGINISIGGYNPPIDYWCFAPRRYISSPLIYNHCIDRSRNVTIINHTTIINNYGRRNNVFYNGPRRIDAERYTGRINPVRFRESSRPGRSQFRNNEVSVYRPRVRRDDNRQFTPRSFDRYERNGNNNGFGRDRDNNSNRGNGNNLPVRRDRDDRIGNRDNNNDARPQNNNNGGNRRFERRDEMRRPDNGQQRPDDVRRERRTFEQRNNEVRRQPGDNNDRRAERRNEFERNRNNQASQPGRREMRNDNRFERQPSQRTDRQQQRQQGQMENNRRGNDNREQRGGNNNNERGRSRRG